jgi:hypothetical protein
MISKPEYEEPLFKDYQLDKPALNKVIAEHMFRSGYFTSGEAFSEETSLPIEKIDSNLNEDLKNKFKNLNKIVSELRESRKVTLALHWARENSEELKKIQSDLLFQIHYVEFTQIIRN